MTTDPPDTGAYVEREAKYYLPDLDAMQARLTQAAAQVIVPRVFERNVRYDDAQGTFAARHLVLRLRQDDAARLTFKAPMMQSDVDVESRFEAEVTVSDFDTMAIILARLGYVEAVRYEKYRTTYDLDGLHIMLDELPYGDFIELEGEADAIRRAAARLSLPVAQRMDANYIDLFERVRQALRLDVANLTFAAFAGVDVPFSAFLAARQGD